METKKAMVCRWYVRVARTALHLIVTFLFSLSASAQAPTGNGVAEKSAVEQTFRDYIAAFSAGDPKKIATYYHEPTMLVLSRGARVLSTAIETEAWIAELSSALQSRGVADVAIDQLSVKLLGQGVALLSASYRRRAKDGSVIERVASSYLLRKSEYGWKIATVTGHPPDDVIKLD